MHNDPMGEGPPVLTVALLEEYADRLRTLGVPIIEHLAPGLSEEEMDATTEPLGLRLPPEARVWWGWQNAIPPEPRRPPETHRITPAQDALPLAAAVVEAQRTATIIEKAGGQPGDLWWPTLLPVVSTMHGALIAVDGALPHEPTSTVYYLDWEGGIMPKARSLGEMVRWWIEAVDSGAYGFDPDRGRWTYDWDRLTQAQRASVLV